MKKLLLSASLIAAFMLYVVYVHPELVRDDDAPPPHILSLEDQALILMQSGMGSGMMDGMPMEHMMMYKNGEYTGKVVDVYYGNVEVKAIMRMGRLVDVRFLQYPNDRSTSIAISNEVIPALTTEAIKAQSAAVDIISGATQTSEGFMASLADALAQAKG